MRPYLAIISARFRMLLQYRTAAVAGIATQVFWGLIRMMIFCAFYRSTRVRQPMSYPEVVTYVWLGQAMLALLPWNADSELRAMIRTGNVAYELTRPLDLYNFWFSRALAWRTAPTLLRAVPMFIIAGLFFGLKMPASFASGLAWVAATIGALLLSCAITTLINASLFWTISGDGISRMLPSIVTVLSGMIIPIPLFPDWAQTIINILPFRGLVDTPFRLYMGNIPPQQAVWLVGNQLIWAAALIILGRYVLARGVRMLVAQGG